MTREDAEIQLEVS